MGPAHAKAGPALYVKWAPHMLKPAPCQVGPAHAKWAPHMLKPALRSMSSMDGSGDDVDSRRSRSNSALLVVQRFNDSVL